MLAETAAAGVRPTDKSETRIDIALLVSALFLQRFSLPFGTTLLHLELVAIGIILFYQFLSGKKLVCQYDRLLWFLAFAFTNTCSLLLNFKSTMLTGYFQFVVFFFLFTLIRRSTPDQYKSTLQAFQFVVLVLSGLGVAQFVAQFAVDGGALMNFYGITPHFLHLLPVGRFEGSLLKSNALFLSEPSTFSQITALGILIEVLEFHRPRYLAVMALGFLAAYSGTGLLLLLIFLPLAGLRHGRAAFSALLVAIFVVGLVATGIIHLYAFTSRVGEFEDTGSSGFLRFVAPFWSAAKNFDTASLQALLLGNGPGTVKTFSDLWYATGEVNWLKHFYEYGIIGSFIFCCFLASCLRKSRCRGLVIVVLLFNYLFEQGTFSLAIVLCTLHGPDPRRRHVDEASRYGPPLVARSPAG
jgi:hypothetical protein